MTEQERINFALQRQMERLDAKIQIQIDAQTARMNVIDARIDEQGRRIDATLAELKEQRQDIRDLNKKLDETFKQTMIGVGGMILALGAFLVAVLK